jgi:hypothetical protein
MKPFVGLHDDPQPGARDVVELAAVGGQGMIDLEEHTHGPLRLGGVEAADQLEDSVRAGLLDLEHQSPGLRVTVMVLLRS